MRDWLIPLVKSSCLCGCPQGIPRSDIHVAFSLWSWLMVKTCLIRHSPQCLFVTSETHVTDLARISRLKQADEIRPDRHAFLPSETYVLSWQWRFIRFKGHVMHKTFIIRSIFNVPLPTKTAFLGPLIWPHQTVLQTSATNSQFWEVAKFSTESTVMTCLTGEFIQHQSKN